jgi:hypothetical protein
MSNKLEEVRREADGCQRRLIEQNREAGQFATQLMTAAE